LIHNKIGALSNLIFSKYFLNYLGFDDENGMYFFEIPSATMKISVKKMINENKNLLSFPNLFKYWVTEILNAFKDLAYQCNYQMEHDITVSNLFVADFGIKLFFKEEVYGNPKRPGLQNHLYYESLLL
jgi:hypothetical protein